MAKIHNLKIKNFKGVKELDHTFGSTNFVCFVGRGDSGKTTLLEAIEYVLYPNWNLSVTDNDFFNCVTSIPLEIEVTLPDLNNQTIVASYESATSLPTQMACVPNPLPDSTARSDLSSLPMEPLAPFLRETFVGELLLVS